ELHPGTSAIDCSQDLAEALVVDACRSVNHAHVIDHDPHAGFLQRLDCRADTLGPVGQVNVPSMVRTPVQQSLPLLRMEVGYLVERSPQKADADKAFAAHSF